jgi:hypothetical protein
MALKKQDEDVEALTLRHELLSLQRLLREKLVLGGRKEVIHLRQKLLLMVGDL